MTGSPPPAGRGARRGGSLRPRSARKRRAQRRRSNKRLWLVALVAVPALLLIATAVGGTAVFGSRCDLNALRPVAVGENTFVYAWDGSLLGAIPAEKNRTPVTRAEISPWLPRATVAIEDRRFYSHGGVDPVGILRAVVADVKAGKVVQGGSTITQELVRNLYLSRERTVKRKLTEACLAIKLADKWSKDRILTAYMNQVYYGNHAYGIEAAAETYFSIPAKDLDLEQSALLAGLPQAPSSYDPFHSPGAALARRNEVLRAMRTSGDITTSQYAAAVGDTSLHLKPGSAYTTIKEPYFFGYVEDLLQQEYGANTVRSGGLKVYTTINPHLQSAAKAAITHILDEKGDPASSVVSIDPRSGAIRAMTAVTPGDTSNQFNFATSALRQPGSTFKTIALTAAVARGMNPFTTTYLSAPFTYRPDKSCDPTQPSCVWNVQTYEHTYAGVESVAAATLQSDNTVYARLSLDVGPDNIAAMAEKLGVRTPLQVNGYTPPSIALGSVAVTPLDMASAYATLAAGGVYSKPMAITKVVLANGQVDTQAGWGKPQRTRVIPDWVASTVTKVLEENMISGTGTGAHVAGHSDAGKTGTTDKYADAWFSGYTPFLEATVWIGYPKGEIPMLDVHGIAVSGPTFPASIWHLYMETAIGKRKDVAFREPTSTPSWTFWKGHYQYYGLTTTTTESTTSKTITNPPATKPLITIAEPTIAGTTAVPAGTRAETTTAEPATTAEPPPATTEEAPPAATAPPDTTEPAPPVP
jgi:penicillin-binding protein 1A